MPTPSLSDLSSQIRLRVYRGVGNGAALAELTADGEAGAGGQRFARCVVLDLGNVVSDFHVRSAVLKAILCTVPDSGFRGKAGSFRGNVLFNLAATGKVSDTVAQFGVSAASTSVAVVGWVPPAAAAAAEVGAGPGAGAAADDAADDDAAAAAAAAEYEELAAAVQGQEFDPALLLSDAEFTSDDKKKRLVKMYKITPAELEMSSLEDCVVTRLAVKEVL